MRGAAVMRAGEDGLPVTATGPLRPQAATVAIMATAASCAVRPDMTKADFRAIILSMRLETIAVHAGHAPDQQTGAVTPPIHLSTTFERLPDGSFPAGFIYSRYGNPNRQSLEQCLAQLETGGAAACFASGSAATMAVLQSLEPDAHIVIPDDAYYGTTKLIRDIYGPWRLRYTAVDMTSVTNVESALTERTRVVWAETPSNPMVRVVDLAAIAAVARKAGAWLVVDNTWATPVLQRPLTIGADLVMHSTTKYLGGHSDVLGGALVAASEEHALFARARAVQSWGGAAPSPFECWLTLRGIRTLPWRVRAQCDNAGRLAEYLSTHSRVECVHYPGLSSHPGHAIAKRQMSAPGAMLSFQVRGGRDDAMAFTNRLRVFTRATSLGGTDSLIEHRRSVEGAESRAPDNLLRVSVGLEHPDDLLEDLEQALR